MYHNAKIICVDDNLVVMRLKMFQNKTKNNQMYHNAKQISVDRNFVAMTAKQIKQNKNKQK